MTRSRPPDRERARRGDVPLRADLVVAFSRRGLLPDPDTYQSVRERIRKTGRDEYERLAAVAGDAWATVPAADAGLSRRYLERVLGFGRALTAFLAAPADVPADECDAVERLGATANALVSMFDQYVDHGFAPDAVLSRVGLRAALVRNRLVDAAYERLVGPRKRATYRLVACYFDTFGALPYATERSQVRRALHERIHEMYEAERRSAHEDDPQVSRTTSVLPMVVLGLPGWLATPTFDQKRYERHLAWLRETGEFFALLDDAVDIREDATDGAYNAVKAALDDYSRAAVVNRIASKGRRVRDEWRVLAGDRSLERGFTTAVASWLGGPTPGDWQGGERP